MSSLHRIYLALLSLGLAVSSNCDVLESKIVGGTVTTIEKAPFMVWLYTRNRNYQYCGGTLYGDKYVITAAHCADIPAEKILVHGRTSFLEPSGTVREVVRIWTHPNYKNSSLLGSDISIIELNATMGGISKSVELCKQPIADNTPMQIYGWGNTKDGALKRSNQLRVATVSVVPRKACQKDYDVQNQILTKDMFCLQAPGKDSCLADSGGPAIYKNQLCGIISFGQGCADPKYPGVYVDVRYFRNFITKSISSK